MDNIEKYNTFPKLLRFNAHRIKDLPAMREKNLGIWKTVSWDEQYKHALLIADTLGNLGVRKSDKVAIIGDNRPHLYQSMAAIQCLGAVPVPCYQDSVAVEMSYIIEHAEAKVAIVENQEQVDKILEIYKDLSRLEYIIYDDPSGLEEYTEKFLIDMNDILTGNKGVNGSFLESSIDTGVSKDIAVMLYTSGTTGRPKGVLLTYENLITSASKAVELEGLSSKDSILAYLPMAWIGDNIFSYAQSYIAGFCVNCPESSETVQIDLREIGPTYYFGPPRIFENMITNVRIKMADAHPLKQKIFNYFLKIADRFGDEILSGKSVHFLNRIKYFFGEILIYGPLKNVLGLSNVKVGYTAGEAISPDIFKFFRSLGINLKQLYGSTEASVYVSLQRDGEVFPDSVGKPFPGVEVRVIDGEVQFKSKGVFMGYYKDSEATSNTKTKDGFVKTGDAGYLDKTGNLKIIDRAKDVGKFSNGDMFAPKYIENKLKFHPFIKEAVSFGDGRIDCCCFINIDLEAVGSWAERNNLAYSGYTDLAKQEKVYELVAEAIKTVNHDLSKDPKLTSSQISRFLILHKELDADDGELTRTQKVRRTAIAERYGELIEALYNGSKDIYVKTEVTFEDGKKGNIEANISIYDLQKQQQAVSGEL